MAIIRPTHWRRFENTTIALKPKIKFYFTKKKVGKYMSVVTRAKFNELGCELLISHICRISLSIIVFWLSIWGNGFVEKIWLHRWNHHSSSRLFWIHTSVNIIWEEVKNERNSGWSVCNLLRLFFYRKTCFSFKKSLIYRSTLVKGHYGQMSDKLFFCGRTCYHSKCYGPFDLPWYQPVVKKDLKNLHCFGDTYLFF